MTDSLVRSDTAPPAGSFMPRSLGIVIGAALFGLVGLGTAFGIASLRAPNYRPDWELLAFIALPPAWTFAGLVAGWLLSDSRDRESQL